MRQPRLFDRLIRFSILVLATMLFTSAAVFGQSDTGSIAGTVKDQNGAIVPGASVTAKNQRTGEERNATTNTDGVFSIPALRASAYTVTATAIGLGSKGKDVEVNVGRETNLNIGR